MCSTRLFRWFFAPGRRLGPSCVLLERDFAFSVASCGMRSFFLFGLLLASIVPLPASRGSSRYASSCALLAVLRPHRFADWPCLPCLGPVSLSRLPPWSILTFEPIARHLSLFRHSILTLAVTLGFLAPLPVSIALAHGDATTLKVAAARARGAGLSYVDIAFPCAVAVYFSPCRLQDCSASSCSAPAFPATRLPLLVALLRPLPCVTPACLATPPFNLRLAFPSSRSQGPCQLSCSGLPGTPFLAPSGAPVLPLGPPGKSADSVRAGSRLRPGRAVLWWRFHFPVSGCRSLWALSAPICFLMVLGVCQLRPYCLPLAIFCPARHAVTSPRFTMAIRSSLRLLSGHAPALRPSFPPPPWPLWFTPLR